MRNKLRLFLLLAVSIQVLVFSLPIQTARTQADPDPFLITPYYGKKNINSFFDHHSPDYTTDGYLLKYTGERLPDPDPLHCTPGVNCYDGHNGYDFAMQYESVLAAATGTVVTVGWDGFNCHTCGYGLYIVIRHSVNGVYYYTRYGHLTTVAVQVNQTILAGNIIGTSGSTGSSTGPHLHFDVEVDGGGDPTAIDPFRWLGQDPDPWQAAVSWCMWVEGEWATICNGEVERLILPPVYGREWTIDDGSNGFSKGYGGLWQSLCTGVDPGCRGWFESWVGIGGHTYRTNADGVTVIDNWARWMSNQGIKMLHEVFVYDPYIAGFGTDTFSWQVPFTVRYREGNLYATNTTIVDQNVQVGENYYPYDRWLSIGTYRLEGGTVNTYAYATDQTNEQAYSHCPNGPNGWCRIITDAVKYLEVTPIYLPYSPATVPSVRIVNNSAATSNTLIQYLTNNGTYLGGKFIQNGHHNSMWVPLIGTPDSSYVSSNQDAWAAAIFRNSASPINAHAYIGIGPENMNSDFRLSTNQDLPILYSAYYGYSSIIRIQNPNPNVASVTVFYYYTNGAERQRNTYSVNPYATQVINVQSFGWTNFLGTAHVSSTQPVAVVVESSKPTSNMVMDYNAIASGAQTVYLPYLMKTYGGWGSCFVIQNTSPALNYYSLEYWWPGGTETQVNALFGYAATTYCQNNDIDLPSGALWARIDADYPIAVAVNQSTSSQVMSYSGISIANQIISFPFMVSNESRLGQIWSSGFRIQTPGEQQADVWIEYYNDAGTLVLTRMVTLFAYDSLGVYLPNEGLGIFTGSVLLRSSQPIVAIANASCTSGCTYDFSLSYNGYGR